MQHAELIAYIKEAVNHGQNTEEIKATLISHGWDLATVNEHVSVVVPPEAPLTPQEAKVVELKETNPAGMLMNVGIVLTAVGVFSFIASNLVVFSESLILLILTLATTLCLFGGFYSRQKSGPSMTSRALIASGSMLIGATFFLAVRVLDLPLKFPDVCLFWMLAVLPIAIKTDTMALYVFMSLLAGGAALGYPTIGPGSLIAIPLIIASVTASIYVVRTFSGRMPLDKKGYL